MTIEQKSAHARRESCLLGVAAIAAVCAYLATPTLAQQVQWNEIAAPTGKEAVSRTYSLPYRTDVTDVPLGAGGELEYKIDMKAGGTVVYSWEVRSIADPKSFYTEFHGHTEPVSGRGDLMFYEKGDGDKAAGSLIAPWDGIHGWYWQNKTDKPVVVRLRVAGFYEIVPGQAGKPVKE
jgi:hypothetical protein